jgi:hypothetical protein
MLWARPETFEGQHGMPRTLLARPGPSHTSPRTNSVRPPMRSRPHVLPRPKARARPQGGCLGDPHEGCYRTDLPGDQLTGRLPVEVHAGRASSSRNTSILLSSHVRLGTWQVFHPPATEPGYIRTAGGGNPAVLSPLSPLAVPCYSRHRRDAARGDLAVPPAVQGPPAYAGRTGRLSAIGGCHARR